MLEIEMTSLELERNAGLVRRRRAKARMAAVKVQGRAVISHVLDHGPENTMRLKASYAQAGNQAGVGRFVVPAIVPDPDAERIEAILLDQLQTAQAAFAELDWQIKAAEKYDQSRGTDQRRTRGRKRLSRRMSQPYYRKIRAQRNKIRRRLEAAERAWVDWNQSQGTAIVFNQFAALREMDVGKRQILVTRRAVSVRRKVYGGSGRSYTSADAAIVHFTSHEPHVRVVQRNTRFMTNALKAINDSSVRRLSKKAFVGVVADGIWSTGTGAGTRVISGTDLTILRGT